MASCRKMRKLRWLLLATMSAAFLNPFSGSSINIALPVIGKTFHEPIQHVNWVATSFLLTSAIFLLTAGKLADFFSQKKVFVLGLIFFSIFTLLCGLSQNLTQLIIFRIFQGIGSSFLFATSVSILSHVAPPEIRGKVLGYNSAAIYLGLLLGPTLGGILIHWVHWRSIFFFPFVISLFALFMAICFIPTFPPQEGKKKINVWENLYYWISLATLIYAMSIASSPIGVYLLLLAIALLISFVILEYKIKNPLLDVHLFSSNALFAFSNLAALVNYATTFAIDLLLSYYLQKIKNFSADYTGYILMVQPLMMVIFSPIFGRLSDMISPGKIASGGMLLIAIGLLFLYFIKVTTPLWWIIVGLLLIGLGFSLFSTPITNAVMSSVPKSLYGRAAATLATMRVIGQMLSMGIVMLVFSLHHASTLPMGDDLFLLQAIKKGFLVFAILSLGGIFLSLKRI